MKQLLTNSFSGLTVLPNWELMDPEQPFLYNVDLYFELIVLWFLGMGLNEQEVRWHAFLQTREIPSDCCNPKLIDTNL